jgi:hypothetical protein
MEGACPETVESHVFGVGLRDKHRKASLCEIANWSDIFNDISAGKSLIG